MWTLNDYDELKTFEEYVKEHPLQTLFSGTDFETDEATQTSVYDYFMYRKVVDNERFDKYFKRALNICSWQYYQYLRAQNSNIDPLVSDYMERQTKHTGSRSGNSSDNYTDTTVTNNSGTNKTTGSNIASTQTLGSMNSNGTSSTEQTDARNSSATSYEDSKHKHGETPQAAVGSGEGMALDWTYLSSQDETETNGNTSGQESGTSNTSGTTSEAGTTETTNTSNATSTNNGEYADQGRTTKTNTGSKNESSNENSDERERYTGRHEAPQDLLKRAVEYIEGTNAFLWLVKYLDNCFMQILEV